VAEHVGVSVRELERLLGVHRDFDLYAVIDAAAVLDEMRRIEARTAGQRLPRLELDELDTVRLVAGLRQADFGTLADSVFVGDRPADAGLVADLRRAEPTPGKEGDNGT
jgi:hypothetical protein